MLYLDGYDDGYPTTAPVMSFKPNKLGLYDLGGNVREWCNDWYDSGKKDRLARGGFWGHAVRTTLLSSSRDQMSPEARLSDNGFRIVVETKPQATTGKPVTPAPPVVPPPAPATAAKSDFSNSLGMKFVKVTGTQVLFCIHETRRQDYAVFAAEVQGVDGSWKNQTREGVPCGHEDNHPVVGVSWDDANGFAIWLSKKEGRKFRLPTDKEWSYAVGIGRDEKWTKDTTPEMLKVKVLNEFPWGSDFPPKTKELIGNYGDMAWKGIAATQPFIEGYSDGFATTAPVMSFKPNKLGLYDMGGNVMEWCEDWFNAAQKDRTLRGAGFSNSERGSVLSSDRTHYPPATRSYIYGFRIVVEMTAP